MFEQILNYHRFMLADKNRVKSYQKAIQETVKDGDIVVDIGTGSGLLAFFAVLAGAKRVYAIEQNEIIEEAEKLSEINKFHDKIIFIKGRSDKIDLPEKADVIISEIIGHFGIDENIIKFISDARKRFLKKDGKIIPGFLEIYTVPVETSELWENYIGLWNKNFYGLDLSIIKENATSQQYVIDCSGKITELSSPVNLYRFNLYEDEALPSKFSETFKVKKNGIFHGFTGYFKSTLSQNIIISSSYEIEQSNWKQSFLPLKEAVQVNTGDRIILDLKALSYEGSLFWEWDTTVKRKETDIVKFNQKNRTVVKEDLLNGMEKYIPLFNNHGNLIRKVLLLFDGKRNAGDVAKILMKEYPENYKYFELALQDVLGVIEGCINLKLMNIKRSGTV